MRIALLEDDIEQSDVMQVWLENAGHTCTVFDQASKFKSGVKNESFDILVLDWMLPQSSGLLVLKWIRESAERKTPVLFLTSRDDEKSIVEALENGADDYIVKPSTESIFNARINALARRSGVLIKENDVVEYNRFKIDYGRRTVYFDDEPFELTNKEYELTAFMFRNAGKVVSRAHTLEAVWGSTADIATRKVDTHMSRLRNKLSIKEENGWRIVSIYQHGYRLEAVD